MGFTADSGDPDFYAKRRRLVRFGAIGEGWELFKERWGTWVVAGLIVNVAHGAVLSTIHSLFRFKLPAGGGGFRIALPPSSDVFGAMVVMVIDGVLLGALFRLACLQVRGKKFTVGDMFGVNDVIVELVFGSAALGAALGLATCCGVVPAFFLAGLWMFALPLIVDARLRAFAAFGRSWDVLKREWLTATVFHTAVSVLAGFGCCGCCGAFLTMPLYCLSIAVLYRDAFLTPNKDGTVKPTAPDPYF